MVFPRGGSNFIQWCYRGDEEIGDGDTFQILDPESGGFDESIDLGLETSQVIFDLGLDGGSLGKGTVRSIRPGSGVIKLYSCSTQLSIQFKLLINTKIAQIY